MKWKSYQKKPGENNRPGDAGSAKLLDGEPRKKSSAIFMALNNIWELNCAIGIARFKIQNSKFQEILMRIQNDLFIIQANLATSYMTTPPAGGPTPEFGPEKTDWLEKYIEKTTPTLPKLTTFVLPGGNIEAALFDWLGAITRRAESFVHKAHEENPLNSEVPRYINRLSDFFFILARQANFESKTPETPPTYT